MSKYIDLYEKITETRHTTVDYRRGVVGALDFLDRNPDQVPGRTITQSDFDYAYELYKGVDGDVHYEGLLRNLGISIIPEPTNAEKLEQLHDQYRRFPGQHLPGSGSFADYLDHKGVKAPDHD